MTDNSQNYESLQERNQQALTDIAQLQTTEKQLYDSLDNVNLTTEQKQQIIARINDISQMRLNIYANLKDMYSYYQENVSSSRNTLGEQMVAVDIIENELNEAKRRLNLIQDQKYNKLRMVEINTYYGKRYNAHKNVMKTIAIVCVPIIILGVLSNNGILPPRISALLIGIVVLVGVVLVGSQLIDMSNRDSMNWDEYNWYFDKSKAPSDTTQGTATNPWASASVVCVGSQCCSQQEIYDSTKNMCVPAPYVLLKDTNSPGNDMSGMPVFGSNAPACQKLCDDTQGCNGFVFDNIATNCWLKNSTNNKQPYTGIDLYIKNPLKSLVTESMVSGVLSKHSFDQTQPVARIGQNNVQPNQKAEKFGNYASF
jgi:PAN domain